MVLQQNKMSQNGKLRKNKDIKNHTVISKPKIHQAHCNLQVDKA